MSTFIIQDWAANTLQYNKSFNWGEHKNNIGVPMEFKSFDDAWEYIFENYNEDEFEELNVEEIES